MENDLPYLTNQNPNVYGVGLMNTPYIISSVSTTNPYYNHSFFPQTSTGIGEAESRAVNELRETVQQLRIEMEEIKKRLNTSEKANHEGNFRKIAVD